MMAYQSSEERDPLAIKAVLLLNFEGQYAYSQPKFLHDSLASLASFEKEPRTSSF